MLHGSSASRDQVRVSPYRKYQLIKYHLREVRLYYAWRKSFRTRAADSKEFRIGDSARIGDVRETMWDCMGKIIITEVHYYSREPQAAGLAASTSFEEYSRLLRDEPHSFHLLHQSLLQLNSSQQSWTFTGLENEATFI